MHPDRLGLGDAHPTPEATSNNGIRKHLRKLFIIESQVQTPNDMDHPEQALCFQHLLADIPSCPRKRLQREQPSMCANDYAYKI